MKKLLTVALLIMAVLAISRLTNSAVPGQKKNACRITRQALKG